MKQVRCFVAIELEPPTASLLRDVAACVRDADPGWAGEKWVAQGNLHVTLKFMGDLPEAVLPLFALDLAAATATTAVFDLQATGLSARPSARRCNLVWVDLADAGEHYAALSESVDDAAADYGVRRDQRPPRAHVTLVRARRPKMLSAQAFEAGSLLLEHLAPVVSVVRATILTSTLTRSGPIYSQVATAPLLAAAPPSGRTQK